MKRFWHRSGYIIAVFILVSCGLILANIGGCKKEKLPDSNHNNIPVIKTSCKTGLTADSFDQDCINYSFTGNKIHIKHINAGFNCCPNKVYVTDSIINDTIIITEIEVLTNPCKCDCLYDIEYDIPDIPGGSYMVIINEPFISLTKDKIVFKINTSLSATGNYCITRNAYPWQ